MTRRYADLLQRVRPYWPLAAAAAVIGLGILRGLGVALLSLAGLALLWAIAMLWQSVQSLGDDTELSLEEALAMAAPSAEEEQKRAVLRALKDLEYERSVGKVSDEDYEKLSTRYRADAKRLLQALDRQQTPAREKVEKLVARRLAKAGLDAPGSPAREVARAGGASSPAIDNEINVAEATATEDDGERDDDETTSGAPSRKTCEECQTENDADARFCKNCGGEL